MESLKTILEDTKTALKDTWNHLDFIKPVAKLSLITLAMTTATISIGSFLGGKKEVETLNYKIEKHDVDQIFRDHNGYRIFFDDEKDEVQEKKYFEDGEGNYWRRDDIPSPVIPEQELSQFVGLGFEDKKHIRIFRDLSPGAQGYANVIHYSTSKGDFGPLYYVEMHIPKNENLSAGNEVYGGKFSTHEAIKEIK